jgi:hypothetical protein
MNESFEITHINFERSTPEQAESGLVGWIEIIVGGILRIDGVALRRTTAGRLALSFPERVDACGRRHPILRPVDDLARRELERSVFAALGIDGSMS